MTQSAITDSRGLALSAPDQEAVGKFDAIVNDIYYYRLGSGDRLDALIQDAPEFVLPRVLKGYSLMSEGALDTPPKAREYLKAAEALPANRRERLHQEALRAWIAGDYSSRAAVWEQILLEWPLDLLAFRQYTGTLFWSGDKRHQAQVTASIASHWNRDVPGYGHYMSAHSFALEEVGQYAVAEKCARAALDIEPQDLWAMHALAHVLEMQGRVQEGIAELNQATTYLNDYNLFRGHLWWHLALFLVSERRFDEVLALFDGEIYPQSSTFYLDIQNGASLLARLEFQGIDVGAERWERIAQASLKSSTQHTIWFTAMHHVMALMRSGRISAVQATLDYLRSAGADSNQAALAHELSEAAAAYYQGNPRKSLQGMLSARQRRGDLGASHAQQDLYDQFMVMAALELDDIPRVRELLKARRGTRVWDEGSWQVFEANSRRVDNLSDAEAIRTELLWAAE
ncbi:MAG TPA: tetratricopeptide repeat protein [Pseudomonadales bacterium]|nr:tetratricopeptide repeat protein [Pseudomonadales bacterium]